MNGSVLDAIAGKHYDLETFENELVKVESAGPCIRVGIKNDAGIPSSWWEPSYPFTTPPPGVSWPRQNGWEFMVEAPTHEETRAILVRRDRRYVLILRVTDPAAHPKPVTVIWE